MKKYYINATPYFEWKYRDSTGALADPDTSYTCAIYDQKGKLASATETETLIKSETGIYYYNGWTIPSGALGGIYKAIATFTDGSNVTRDDNCVIEFEVIQIGG